MFDRHANLKYKFGNRHFWSEGYYVSTVGLNDATVAKYIREQEMHDIAMDKMSVKEYANPFSEANRWTLSPHEVQYGTGVGVQDYVAQTGDC